MVAHHPGQSQLMLVERAGVIHRFEDHPGAKQLTEVLDLRGEVDTRGDAGLVAAAFHPQFAQNGQIFLSYTAFGGTVTRSRVTRYTSSDGGRSYDRESRRVLIDFDQTDPWRIHLNGDMKFGPDGFLYIGFGDGGPQGDPDGHAQSWESFRGKILRIDVDRGSPYAIPADNPLLDSGGRPEIFAFGLRNPWRFSFDPYTGLLWVGDVGLDSWEEINQVFPGANLGWPILEGTSCVSPYGCETGDSALPVAEYAHGAGASVVGGFVYRGRAIPSLAGRYVFADYARGEVWALTANGEPVVIARTGLRIVSLAEEPSGELLLVDFSSGRLFRLVPQAPLTETLADRLSATGCFLTDDPRQPAPGLVEFDVRVPFWSDGAVKRRFMALPEGQSAQIRADGSILFPVGSVLAKEFFLGTQRIETRLMMKYREGLWTGASYVWQKDGRDARLLTDSDDPERHVRGGGMELPQPPGLPRLSQQRPSARGGSRPARSLSPLSRNRSLRQSAGYAAWNRHSRGRRARCRTPAPVRGRHHLRDPGPGLPARQLRHLPYPQRSDAGRHGPAFCHPALGDAHLRRAAQGGRPRRPRRPPTDAGGSRSSPCCHGACASPGPDTCHRSALGSSTRRGPTRWMPGSRACGTAPEAARQLSREDEERAPVEDQSHRQSRAHQLTPADPRFAGSAILSTPAGTSVV